MITEQNPYNLKAYKDNDQILAHGQQQPWTRETIEEYEKCRRDKVYFARKYVKIINLDRGLINFDLYPYQEEMYRVCDNNRFTIVLAPRQSGKSIAFVIYLLHYAIFNSDKNVLILANKLDTAMEMLSRIQLALENLPFFLQPGCKALNKKSIEFSNNSKIIARAASSNSARGISANLVYLDEFAFVDRAEKFYTSTYPVITSGKSTRVLITSTANGMGNVFHKLWRGAVNRTNAYQSFEVHWSDVPGRDEAWKEETIANTSERQFQQEFENKFLGSSKTLIEDEFLLMLQANDPEVKFSTENVKVYEKPNVKRKYVITADVAEGIGGDFSAFVVTDVSKVPFTQVAAFKSNRISPYMFAELLVKFAKIYMNAYLCIENNDRGSLVNHIVYHDLEYDNLYVESVVKRGAIGIKTTRKTKKIGCSNFKDLIEQGKYNVVDGHTIEQICTFEETRTSWAASSGNHDDLVMCLVIFAYLASTSKFSNEFEIDLKKTLFDAAQTREFHENEAPPFGVIDSEFYNKSNGEELFTFHDEDEEGNTHDTRFIKDDVFGVVVDMGFDEGATGYNF